ncbi:MAG: hypothetical protein R2809_12980 [Flavobacteriales bacterium]
MRKLGYILLAAVIFTSCKKDEKQEETNTPVVTESGVYVLNEGSFMNNNASISYINSNDEVSLDPFSNANNGIGLGDVLQSMVIFNNEAYAVLNNSGKVEVFDAKTFASITTIESVNYPRYIVDGGNGKLYLTTGAFAGEVLVIDPNTHSVVNSIAVGNGPEQLIVSNGKLFVCNSGGFDEDNTVSVIDLNTEAVIETLTVGDRPVDIDVDASGNVWVMCQGKTVYNEDWSAIIEETPGRLVRILGSSLTVSGNETIGVVGDHPSKLEVEGNTIYYVNNNVYKLSIGSELPGALFRAGM